MLADVCLWTQQEIGNNTLHHTLTMYLHYLAKLKMPLLLLYNYSCYKNLHRDLFIVSPYVIHII